jgi:ATP-binding cassette subfamily F protein 3
VNRGREQRRQAAEERQARYRLRQVQKACVHKLETEIAELERRQAALTAELEHPDTYQTPGRAAQVNRELPPVLERLEELTAEWEAEASKLAELEAD